MTRLSVRFAASTLTALLAISSQGALAAGFYLTEVGSPGSLGTAGVANPTNTVGADSAWTNPAGMTGVQQQRVLGGFQLVLPRIKFDAQHTSNDLGQRVADATGNPFVHPVYGDEGSNAGEIAPVPSMFYVLPLSDKARFGFSTSGPLGGGVNYGNNFVGRYSVESVTLAGAGLTPSFAYQVTDDLSLGVGLSAIYTTLEQKIAVRRGAPDPATDGKITFKDLSDWAFQGILGLTYQISDRALLGIVYRTEADTDLKGDVRYQNMRQAVVARLPTDISVKWTNPQWLEAGLRFKLDDKTILFTNLGWQEWSKFSENLLSFDNDRVAKINRQWDDTWRAGLAVARQLSERSMVSVGFSYDSSPVKEEHRTFDFPVDETWKLSAGYNWQHSDDLFFAVGATFYLMGNAPLSQTSQGVTVTGDYDSNMLAILGATLRYNF